MFYQFVSADLTDWFGTYKLSTLPTFLSKNGKFGGIQAGSILAFFPSRGRVFPEVFHFPAAAEEPDRKSCISGLCRGRWKEEGNLLTMQKKMKGSRKSFNYAEEDERKKEIF